MRVRLATPEDLPALHAIEAWAIEHTIASFHLEPPALVEVIRDHAERAALHPWLVAEQDGEIRGFARSGPWKARLAYRWSAEVTIYVHPAHHRRGVGRALYRALLPLLRAQGYRTALAGITLPNPGSVALHEAFGFTHVGNLRQVGYKRGGWRDVGYWQVVLDDRDGPPGPLRPVSDVVGEVPGVG